MRIGFLGQGVLHQRGGDDTVHPEAAAEHIDCVVGNLPFFMVRSVGEEIPLHRLLLGCQVDAPHSQGPDRLIQSVVAVKKLACLLGDLKRTLGWKPQWRLALPVIQLIVFDRQLYTASCQVMDPEPVSYILAEGQQDQPGFLF